MSPQHRTPPRTPPMPASWGGLRELLSDVKGSQLCSAKQFAMDDPEALIATAVSTYTKVATEAAAAAAATAAAAAF
eukprot:11845045-Heterocapsa_arctica.AAC.1